tara:strand:+ start:29641 stop:32502 length:2862 start_codon:yes stop_codon:yes gene_type:complete
MISKPKNILAYAKAHPIKSAVLGAFTFFTILGAGFGTFYAIAPESAEALITGGPGCCGGTYDPIIVDPWIPGGGGGFGGGGGGGGGSAPAPTCTLSANPNSILAGGSSTLTWTTSYANEVTIDNGVGGVAIGSGTTSVSPPNTTTYRLSATNTITGRTTVCTAAVTVTPAPVAPSCTLDIAPAVVELGNSASASWTTTNGSTFSISGGIGPVTPVAAGSTTITPTALGTYTYIGVVTSATGETATCTDSLEVIPPIVVNAPSCELNVIPETITIGDTVSIEWDTRFANTFSIDNGIGAISILTTPVAGGVVKTVPTTEGTITYTGTVTALDGTTVTCSDTVNVLPVGVDAPACTLTTDGLGAGETETTIYWTLINVVSATLNGKSIAPVDGSQTVGAGTYTLTGSNTDGVEVTCGLVIEPPLDGPACTLTADKLSLAPGETTTINWTINNATEATLQHLDAVSIIDPTDGSQSAVAGTYTLSVGNGVQSDTCEVTIATVTPGVLSCTLDIDEGVIRSGQSANMTWSTNEAVSFTINGDDKDLSGTEVIRPLGVQIYTYTGIATDADGNTVECADTIQVTGGSGGGGLSCAMSFTESNIKSGGKSTLRWEVNNADPSTIEINQGIGSVDPIDSADVTKNAVGTHEYILTARGDGDQVTCRATLTVSGGSGGCTSGCGGGSRLPQVTIDFLKGPNEQPLAFVTLSQIPYTGIELGQFGTVIYWLFLTIWSGAVAYLVLFKIVPFTGRKLAAVKNGVSEAINATEEGTMDITMHEEMEDIQMDGFSPKQGDEALSVEDIVRGLSRMHQESRPVASEIEVEEEEPEVYEADVAREMETAPVQTATPHSTGEELQLLNALMSGDRDTSFSLLRRATRNGGRPDLLIEKVLVHLDAAYRARIDGIPCSEDVRRATAALDTALLEEVISSLASAIDTTYSQSQTGAKLALARAHAVIERG